MVEPSEQEQYINRLRDEFSKEERAFTARKDAEYHDLLRSLGEAVELELQSFDDLSGLQPNVLERNIHRIAKSIAADGRENARYYALEALFGGNAFYSGQTVPLSYEALRILFDAMPHDSPDGQTMDLIANAINGRVADLNPGQVADLLSMFEDKRYTPDDLAVLYIGLQRIRDKSYDERIASALRAGLRHTETAWTAADGVRKKGFTALLPDLHRALRLVKDPEIKRVVQKAITALSK